MRRTLESRFKLLGVRGLVATVLAGVDVACWDALAIAAGLPLARLLGAPLRPIPAYNSNGLGLVEPERAADEALELVAEGFRAVKLRLGRPSPRDDLAAVRALRTAIGPDVALMADYNRRSTSRRLWTAAGRSTTRACPGSRSRSGTTTTRRAPGSPPSCARPSSSARTSRARGRWRSRCDTTPVTW